MRNNIFLLLLFSFCFFAVWIFGGSLYSYMGGFVSTFMILLATGWRMYSRVQNALRSQEMVELAHVAMQKHWEDEEEDKPKPKRFSSFSLKSGLGLFLTPLRLLSYGVLIVIVLVLIKQNEFDIISFLIGNTLAIAEATLFLRWLKR